MKQDFVKEKKKYCKAKKNTAKPAQEEKEERSLSEISEN